MRRNKLLACSLVIFLAVLLAYPLIATAGDPQFDAIVHRIREHYHKGPNHLMGLASFVANRVHPAGVKNIHIAVFEGLDSSRHPAEKDFDAFMQQTAGPEFRPMVRVISRRDGEQTYIYTRPAGDDIEMLIVTLEANEATVVKTCLSPKAMDRWIEEPGKMASKSAGPNPETSEP